jgi:phage-related protein
VHLLAGGAGSALDRLYKNQYKYAEAGSLAGHLPDRRPGFPTLARQIAGYELWNVQQGLEPSDWKPMTSIGKAVAELRIRTGSEYRLVYIAKFPESIYVLHAFEKRTRKTSGKDVRTARMRLARLMESRRKEARP